MDKKVLTIYKMRKIKVKGDFKDILKFSERSLKEVWDNKNDDIWSKYLT